MKPAIEIRNLGKEYKLAEQQPYVALRDVISNGVKNIFTTKLKSAEKFWALKDINLDIMPGERVGIIGRNGAGKSTLLKIISRITPPTTGHATIRGRVGSLLEVGTGFHPELTGRENIYLNGSILGLKKAEINKQLEAIIDFSGVEKFIDVPLKHYSSGMQLRLAFSVAAHLEPEILLIDEVLAVGDIEFQKKCIGKMGELSKEKGRTILFVSHDLGAVLRFTTYCLLLEKGKIIFQGNTEDTINAYHKKKEEVSLEYVNIKLSSKPQINGIRIITSEPYNIHIHGKPLKIEIEINVPENKEKLALSCQLMNTKMQSTLHFWIVDGNSTQFNKKGKYLVECLIPKLRLYKGTYSLNVYLGEDRGKEVFDYIENATPFEISMSGIDPGHSFGWQDDSCLYREEHAWHIQKK